MQKEQIGQAVLYIPEGGGRPQEPDAETRQLQEIVQQYAEEDYQEQITGRRSWTAMYQLAQPRGNVVEWLPLRKQEKVLELAAGCGAVTSVLLKKGAQVTCQEENIHYCRLNAQRHRQFRGLAIYAQPLEACEPKLEHDYDWIILHGMPAGGSMEALLPCLRRHLKPSGVLVLAVENKFGLKYWAGNKEPCTGRYFAGLESSACGGYSLGGLKKMLASAGFDAQEFYYPYPDYRFMRDIYSDEWLPQKGDLTYNIVNYEDDRILLFDEQKVFDSVIEEGMFPFFSNSYLCMAKNGAGTHSADQGEKIIYARYASDRCRAHAVRTEIVSLEKGGERRIVRKRSVYPQGAEHVKHIAESYERLSRQYADTDLSFNRCVLKTENGQPCAEFAFIRAEALQEQVEQAVLAEDMKKVFDILHRMVQYIRNGSRQIPFTMTEEFRQVFGGVSCEAFSQAACSEVSDIDLILSNILEDAHGRWHVIDYEWTFFFPVPQNFIIYRTLFFLNHENPDCGQLAMDRLLEITGITREEAEAYAVMEENFQRFVTGGLVPYREMVNLLERRFFNIVELKADYDRIAAQNELLKGQGIWKIARKLKKKLTGN